MKSLNCCIAKLQNVLKRVKKNVKKFQCLMAYTIPSNVAFSLRLKLAQRDSLVLQVQFVHSHLSH